MGPLAQDGFSGSCIRRWAWLLERNGTRVIDPDEHCRALRPDVSQCWLGCCRRFLDVNRRRVVLTLEIHLQVHCCCLVAEQLCRLYIQMFERVGCALVWIGVAREVRSW